MTDKVIHVNFKDTDKKPFIKEQEEKINVSEKKQKEKAAMKVLFSWPTLPFLCVDTLVRFLPNTPR